LHQVCGHEDKQNALHPVKGESFSSFISNYVWNAGGESFGLQRSTPVSAHQTSFFRVSVEFSCELTPSPNHSEYLDRWG
jgi:hypothetical protein